MSSREKMEVPIDKINQLIQQIQQANNLVEFETIELPFQLVEAGIQLWESTYSPEVLRQIASTDTDTLDAWAIALAATLQTQLELLNTWLPHLATLPVPPTLKQKISDRISSLSQIANEKSQLLTEAASLFNQEQQLRRDADDLQNLKQQAKELQQIQSELQATNLESLRQALTTLAFALEPERLALEALQQQKAQLDDQIAALQQQQARLLEEINYLRSRQQRIETSTTNTAGELITLTKSQQQRLPEALDSLLADLEKQQSDFVQTQQQVQRAIQDFNHYQTATEEMRTHLLAHYQSDSELGSLLPVNQQKVDTLIRNIQQNLAELDQELAVGQKLHSLSQQKTTLTF
jgi:DNA repair exonuclease SbcCD ATPase subunit